MTYQIELKNVTKTFSHVVANDKVNLKISCGEVHAIVGENGAGKSTLMNILFGLLTPDEGEIIIHGNKVELKSPHDSMKNGIGMVHQHFMLVPTLTVLENVILGSEPGSVWKVDKKAALKKMDVLLERFNLNIDVHQKVEHLSVGIQQKIEILKVLYRGADILILDEPTAVLTPQEISELFVTIRSMTSKGKTVIFISHKLNEVLEIADTITVMRDGKVVDTVDKKETNTNDLARMMTGRNVLFDTKLVKIEAGEPILQIKGLKALGDQGEKVLQGVSFEVKAGEIFGIAGVEGNGQSELVEVLFGLRPILSGKVYFKEKEITNFKPWQLVDLNIGYIPADRHKTGLIMDFSIEENLLLGKQDLSIFSNRGFLKKDRIANFADRLIEEYDIRTSGKKIAVKNLSGGNQQKVIFAREMSSNPDFTVAVHPTRGLDIGAIEYVHTRLLKERKQKKGVLLISSELSEVLKLSDRIGVMYRGKIVAILNSEEASEEKLGYLMLGGSDLKVVGDDLHEKQT
jgi:simple sugar transport system ATP-binding protein